MRRRGCMVVGKMNKLRVNKSASFSSVGGISDPGYGSRFTGR
ncbi:hypothetical protein CASFOL_025024 [Castilleja foliolosa]|uniref:Uncharacterized protein n=1 Tax=Castilleja foliolosa TaxID=1961234 RepID=A0ABD3CQ03_9LAMI